MFISRQARMARTAISPRLAIRILRNTVSPFPNGLRFRVVTTDYTCFLGFSLRENPSISIIIIRLCDNHVILVFSYTYSEVPEWHALFSITFRLRTWEKKNSFCCDIRFALVREVLVGAAALRHGFNTYLAYTFWIVSSSDTVPSR